MHEEEGSSGCQLAVDCGSPVGASEQQETPTLKMKIKRFARTFMGALEDTKWYDSEADLIAALEGVYEKGFRDGLAGAYPEMVAARVQRDRSRGSGDPVPADPGRGSGPAHAGPDGDDGGRATGGLPEHTINYGGLYRDPEDF